MDFGDLRSLVQAVRLDATRVDELVLFVLEHRLHERIGEYMTYVNESLSDARVGHVVIGDLVAWALVGVEPLTERLGADFTISDGIVETFLAGWAWAVVRRADKAPYGVIEDSKGNTSLYMYGSPTDAWEMRVSAWVDRDACSTMDGWDITVDDTDWGGPTAERA